MPRAADLFPQLRGGGDVHSPLRGLLDWSSPLSMTAQAAGDQIRAKIEDVVAFIKETTGVDLSGIVELLDLIESATGTDLFGLGALNPVEFLTNLDGALGEIDITQPDAIVQFILENAGNPIGIINAFTGLNLPEDTLNPLSFLSTFGGNLGGLFPGVDLNDDTLNPTSALGSWINNGILPTGLLLGPDSPLPGGNIFGRLPSNLFSLLPVTSVTDALFNLLQNPTFESPAAILDPLDVFTVDPNRKHVDPARPDTINGGSAHVTADGLTHELLSDPETPAKAGETMDLLIHVAWEDLVSTGAPLQLMMVAYNGAGVELAETLVDSVAAPGASSMTHPDADEDGWVPLSGSYTVPNIVGVDHVRQDLVTTAAATGGDVWWSDGEQAKTQLLQMDWMDGLPTLNTSLLQVFDIARGFSIVPINDDVAGFQGFVNGLFGRFQGNEGDHQGLLDQLFGGFLQTSASGIGAGDVGNAAGTTSLTASTAMELGEWVSAVQGLRNTKDLFEGVDDTEEANFKLDKVWNNTGTEPAATIPASAASIPVAYKNFAEVAKKGFISWFGKGTVADLRIDVYRANTATNTWDLIHTSPNLQALVDATWRYLIYNIADVVNRLDVAAGVKLGIAWRVVGAGTHSIAGMPYNQPGHPTLHPKRPVSVRTGSGALTFAATDYSPLAIPWFGIGIIAGDTPQNFYAPRTQAFTTSGESGVYTIPPEFRVAGNIIDRVACGSGSGGSDSFGYIPGQNGKPGAWAGDSLVYGTHIPLGTATIPYHVADKGDSGGGPGEASTSSGPGIPTLSAPGGVGVGGNGAGPGDFDWAGKHYTGGSAQGGSPGAGGAYGFPWFQGGSGGAGYVSFTARQP